MTCYLSFSLINSAHSVFHLIYSSYGYKTTDADWTYLEKFCFDESGGYVNITLTADLSIPHQGVAFYADLERQWPAVYRGDITDCSQRVKVDELAALAYEITEEMNGQLIYLRVKGNRPRWWYVAVYNCNVRRRNDMMKHEK